MLKCSSAMILELELEAELDEALVEHWSRRGSPG